MNLARKNQGFYYDTRGRINYGILEVLQMSSYISSKIRLIRTILTVLLPFLYLLWGTRNGICRFLFTYSSSESPERIGSYYTSLERHFQGEHNAVGIVGNGPELTEIFRKPVLRI